MGSPAPGRGRSARPPLLPERLLARLWRAREGRLLRTVDGRRVRVLYTGRPAPGHGPDFQDAVVQVDGRREHGAVELHRTPSDWRAHGHDGDPAYGNVVLHVVASARGRGPDLPVAELRRRSPHPQAEPPLLERLARMGSAEFRQTLARAGMARFAERTAAAAHRAASAGVEQALHEAVFDALGYAENRAPFVELARLAPAGAVLDLARSHVPAERVDALEQRLLETAGLGGGPSAARMDRTAWRTAGVRPANHPRRRVRAAAALIAAVSDQGLLEACRSACAGGAPALERLLAIAEEGVALVGAGRAREMAVSAVLPVLAADLDGGLADRAAELYGRWSALPENAVTREARRLAGAAGMRLSACEQQGLMRLYRRGVAGA